MISHGWLVRTALLLTREMSEGVGNFILAISGIFRLIKSWTELSGASSSSMQYTCVYGEHQNNFSFCGISEASLGCCSSILWREFNQNCLSLGNCKPTNHSVGSKFNVNSKSKVNYKSL